MGTNLKCEHGKQIYVLVEMKSEYWDDGFIGYDKHGNPDPEGEYVKVAGCDVCKLVRFEVR